MWPGRLEEHEEESMYIMITILEATQRGYMTGSGKGYVP